ncbi:MAG: nitrogen fixation protein NifM [Methylococcaceae bacterium]|nr:MAG: nitrogen fixation protein NifM [Methylococcaceae bacterium]
MTLDTSMPELDYIRLRAALALFDQPVSALTPEQIERAERQALREYDIETCILQAPEAAGIVIGEEQVDSAVAEIRGRFADSAAFSAALAHSRLSEHNLRLGLARQCRVNTVLERVVPEVDAAAISDVEIGLYYHSHFEHFRQPERREAYHILITINDSYRENTRAQALERMRGLAARLAQKPKTFTQLAGKHSECPTALSGGRIGWVRRGQLHSELDEVLFGMRAGQFSGVIESAMGLHLLWCAGIRHPETISLKKATPYIRKLLQDRLQEQRRRAWIAALSEPAG